MSLKGLLKPNRVAVVGASEKEGFGGDTCRNIISIMSDDQYFFVNPKRETVFEKKCYPSLSSLPMPIDLVIICTPQSTVIPLLTEAVGKGAKGAVVFASGYSEVGSVEGKEAESELIEFCRTNNISLMGPNCAGFINYNDLVSSFAFISQDRDRRGSVGFVSQSGQLVLSVMDRPGTKFSYVISAGNASVVSVEEYLHFLIDDENTKVIAMYVEGIKDPVRFTQALDKASKIKKPIVILKTGKSEKAQAIAASHTGSLSGSDQVYDALFEKYGVIRVDDLEELTSTAQSLSVLRKIPAGTGLASISLSGGETAICADLGEEFGLDYVQLEDDTMAKLREILPSYATPNNPLDITASLSYDIDRFAQALEILMKDPKVDLVSIGYTLLQEIADNAIYYMSEAMKRVSNQSWCKPMVLIPFVEMSRNEEYLNKLEGDGIPVLPSSRYAFKIIKNILEFSAYDRESRSFTQSEKYSQENNKKRIALSEAESKQYLRENDIEIPGYDVAKTGEEAVTIFRALKEETDKEISVVAKIDSRDILHKSDIGGVQLNLKSEKEVEEAFGVIMANAKTHCPDAVINGVQITEMLNPGVELIMGVKNDPDYGPVIMCGLGGVFVEVFKDVSLRVAPVSHEEAKIMIDQLKGKVLLEGYRGSEPCDMESLYDLIVKVSQLADKQKNELEELDINPVIINSSGINIADALVIRNSC